MSRKLYFWRHPCARLPAFALSCLPALLSCPLSQPLERSSWSVISTNRTEALSPSPLKFCSSDQSECLYYDQSGTRGGNFCLYKPAPLGCGEHTFHRRLFPKLEGKHQSPQGRVVPTGPWRSLTAVLFSQPRHFKIELFRGLLFSRLCCSTAQLFHSSTVLTAMLYYC